MAPVCLLLALSASPLPAPRQALAEAIARGDASADALVRHGTRGLWALDHALASERAPDARARLWGAVSRFSDLPGPATALLRRGLHSDAPEDRAAAIEGIGQLGLPGHARILLRLAEDPSEQVRMALARTLARGGDRVHGWVAPLAQSASPEARDLALRHAMLVTSGDLQRGLLDQALLDPAAIVRRTAIEQVRLLRDRRHAGIIESLARGSDPREAQVAASALVELPASTPAQLRVLRDASAPIEASLVVARHLRRVRRHVMDIFIPALVDMAATRRDALMARVAENPSDMELQDLVERLDHPDPSYAGLAARWLRQMGARADDHLALAILGARPGLAEAIARHLQSRPGGGVSGALLAQARTSSLPERVAALRTIARLGTPNVRARLLDLLSDEHAQIRAAAAEAVADIEAAEPGLLALTEAREPEVRAAAVRALGRQMGHLAWRARLDALQDESETVRLTAIEGLEGTRARDAISRLEYRVLYGTLQERRAAVRAIAVSPSTEAAVKFVELVAHPDPMVRQAALDYVDDTL